MAEIDLDFEVIKKGIYSKLLVLDAQITNTKNIKELLEVLEDAQGLIAQCATECMIKYIENSGDKQRVNQILNKSIAEQFEETTSG